MASRSNAPILVVEEDQQVRKLIVSILSMAGYEVLHARNGIQASQVVGARDSRPELVIVGGTNLPEGFTTGYRLLLLSPDPARDADRPFLSKPFKPEMLIRKVRDLLG